MRKVLLLVSIVLCELNAGAQVIPVDSVAAYAGKDVIVFGRVNEASFSETKENDTTLFKLAANYTNQQMTLIIYPESRAAFGYRPEVVLLNKTIYVSGKIELNKGKYEIEIKSPFDISFSPVKFMKATNNVALNKYTDRIPSKIDIRNVKPQVVSGKAENNVQLPKEKVAFGSAASPQKVLNDPAVIQKEKINKAPVISKASEVKPAEVKKETPPPFRKEANAQTSTAVETPEQLAKRLQEERNPNVLSKQPVTKKDPLVGTEITLKSNVTIKGGPGNFFTNIGSFKKGEVVSVISCSFDWCKIVQKQAQDGKILGGYVKANKLKE